MYVFVVNSGSSSIKYQLIDMSDESALAKGLCERIGMDGRITHHAKGEKVLEDMPFPTHADALREIVRRLTVGGLAVLTDINQVAAVGHRIATGLDKYDRSVKIDDDVIQLIEKTTPIAPLHVPAMLAGVRGCMEVFPNAVHTAVFDSAFHATIPEKAYIYPLPYEYYEKYGFRKYGFHGSSGRFVTEEYFRLTGRDQKGSAIVICHLGNGSSILAVKDGKSIDTTMGYTPLDGLMMGTRSGSIDPMVLLHIGKKENLSIDQMIDLINKKSGLLGVSGISSDDRDVQLAAEEGNHRAALAREILIYEIKKYIGAYAAAMNGLDAVIFTGGIGENADDLRRAVCSDMDVLGMVIDPQKNTQRNRKKGLISVEGSRCEIWVIPTNEELVLARDAAGVAKKEGKN